MPSFYEDLGAAVEALGVQPVGIVMGIAHTRWDSAEHRDEFLKLLTEAKPSQG